jgi:hypothetical protein
MAPDETPKRSAGHESAPAIPQEDKRLDDSDPPLVSPESAPDDEAYMRIALGADPRSTPPPSALDAPLVYPFIPAPTLEMEPLDDDDQTLSAATTVADPLPVDDCAAAAAERTGPSTPTSTALTAGSVGTTPRTSPDDGSTAGLWAAQDDDGGGKTECDDDEARCSLSYVRRVPSDGGEAAAYHLLHGQVWRRGSADKKRGWRRHQWVVDG